MKIILCDVTTRARAHTHTHTNIYIYIYIYINISEKFALLKLLSSSIRNRVIRWMYIYSYTLYAYTPMLRRSFYFRTVLSNVGTCLLDTRRRILEHSNVEGTAVRTIKFHIHLNRRLGKQIDGQNRLFSENNWEEVRMVC